MDIGNKIRELRIKANYACEEDLQKFEEQGIVVVVVEKE